MRSKLTHDCFIGYPRKYWTNSRSFMRATTSTSKTGGSATKIPVILIPLPWTRAASTSTRRTHTVGLRVERVGAPRGERVAARVATATLPTLLS